MQSDAESAPACPPEPDGDAGPDDTRRRLLDAAGEVFAHQGYKAATVRDICRLAGANVAAIGYHFGGKDGLYAATLDHFFRASMEKFPPQMGLTPDPTPEDRLRAFVRAMLFRVLDDGPSAYHGRLVSHEMIDPTPAFRDQMAREMRPRCDYLLGIVSDLLGPAAADGLTVKRAAWGVIGQICCYHHSRPAVSVMFPEQAFDADGIERLADHVTRFTLAGLKGLREA